MSLRAALDDLARLRIVGAATASPLAALYGPPDGPLPGDGILALGSLNAEQWVFGEVDTELVHALRADGGVLNTRHWAEQPGAAPLPPVEVVDLR